MFVLLCYRRDEESVSRPIQPDTVCILRVHSSGNGHPLRQGWAWWVAYSLSASYLLNTDLYLKIKMKLTSNLEMLRDIMGLGFKNSCIGGTSNAVCDDALTVQHVLLFCCRYSGTRRRCPLPATLHKVLGDDKTGVKRLRFSNKMQSSWERLGVYTSIYLLLLHHIV